MSSKINFTLRLIVAIILLQSLYFKFTGHPEAVHIFSTLGVEPWGRIGLGIIELLTGLALLLPVTKIYASFITIGLMAGAIGTHLFTAVGIVVQWQNHSDSGQLFSMAVSAFVLSLISIYIDCKANKKSLKELIFSMLYINS
jgi:uncharacterized membrane protein YphA (DoxX/SURF4 family)